MFPTVRIEQRIQACFRHSPIFRMRVLSPPAACGTLQNFRGNGRPYELGDEHPISLYLCSGIGCMCLQDPSRDEILSDLRWRKSCPRAFWTALLREYRGADLYRRFDNFAEMDGGESLNLC